MSGLGDSMPEFSAPQVLPEPAIEKLAEALAKAQAQIKGAVKSADNPYFKSKYADLSEVWEVIRKPLSDNGLSVVQLPGWDKDTGRVTLTTMLLHTSGQKISSTISMRPEKDTPQAVGSAITYARRYALAAMVGVVQEDDDGQEASRPENEQRPPEKKPTPKVDQKPATPSKDTRQPADALEEATGIAPAFKFEPDKQYNIVKENLLQLHPTLLEFLKNPEVQKQLLIDGKQFDWTEFNRLEKYMGLEPTPAPTDQPPAGLPTPAERKDFVGRMKIYSRALLPKAGIVNGSDALKAFIVKTTGQEEVKLLTKTQWETILGQLDAVAQDKEALVKLVS